MQEQYEVPELTLIGEADEVVLGSGLFGNDLPHLTGADFEFEHDY